MDHEILARELIRALRGGRSQRAFSRQLGYHTNVLYAWESGRRYPTAAETMRVAARARVDPAAALRRFLPRLPEEIERRDPTTITGVAEVLHYLAADRSTTELARRAGLGRHAVGRWLAGQAEPRLPDFLRLIEAVTLRLLDFIAAFVDPSTLPSVASTWSELAARRQLASQLPWSQAILRVLEIDAYRSLPAHRPGWIAAALGLPVEEEARCVAALEGAGQIVWDGNHYRAAQVLAVDTRPDPDAGRRNRQHWNAVAGARIAQGQPGQYSYNVFAVSRADLERIREMHLAYFRSLRAVVDASGPCEVVGVVNVQLFPLTGS